ncbi:MAG: D-alanyl-D-alanine carboxypeptidase [Candidatus Tokpelaia sp. JSC189]|nr:MAG: D-alanyl-D-alanine carboxypeptidase [Candidatus Tokpelaia sp. JSC189]
MFFRKILYALTIIIYSVSVAYPMSKGDSIDKYAAIVMDANTGRTLYQKNSNAKRYPASLTKMMTLYMFFEALQTGRIFRNTLIPISAYAASRPPTRLGFNPGQTIAAETAAKALIAKSANDVAAAIGEYLGGSEKNFARMMTKKARRLGMMNTNFINASGLPDPQNYSTARDIAILSLALRKHFPHQYRLFNTTQFKFHNKIIAGHNKLIKSMDGVDGIKTGYTRMSGFNLASSRRQGEKSIVAVVMGGKSAFSRDAHMAALLEHYMVQASDVKTLVASRMPAFGKVEHMPIPIPVAKAPLLLTEEIVAIPLAKNMISDHEHDSALLTALTSERAVPSAAADAINEIIIKNPPIPTYKAKNSVHSAIMPSIEMVPIFVENEKKRWVIQIASLPTQSEADRILDKASGSVRAVLANAESYTQYFKQGEAHYYRARFSGFPSKQAAWNACSQLKKVRFSCYALKE